MESLRLGIYTIRKNGGVTYVKLTKHVCSLKKNYEQEGKKFSSSQSPPFP